MGADPAGDLDMGRRRNDVRAPTDTFRQMSEPQYFGLNAMVHMEGTELVNAIRYRASSPHELL